MSTESYNIEDEFDALLDTLTLSLKKPTGSSYPPAEIHVLPPRVAVKPVNPHVKKTPPPVAAKPKRFQRSTTECPPQPPGDVCVDVVGGKVTQPPQPSTKSPKSPPAVLERSKTTDVRSVGDEDEDVGFDLPPPPIEMLGEEEISPPISAKNENIEKEAPKSPPPFNSKNIANTYNINGKEKNETNDENKSNNNESADSNNNNNNNNNNSNNDNDSDNKINNDNDENNDAALKHSNNSTTFGKCGTCGEDIPLQGEGCTTVGSEVYHKDCFKCAECSETLTGIVYYNSTSGKPNCQECYDKTLQLCQACSGKIKERILTAMGMTYHPECFACVVCERKLDGVPFSLDSSAEGKVTCVDCFQAVHSPTCEVCGKLINEANEKGDILLITAMDKSYHVTCYKCEDCGVLLSSDSGTPCYPLQGHLLCQTCNGIRREKMK